MTVTVDYLYHGQQYLHLHWYHFYHLLLQFSMFPFLPTVPQFESKISQLQSEPTAKQQQQEQLVKSRQWRRKEKPTMNNKLQSLYPETDKIFQGIPAEIGSKNKTTISNLQAIAAHLEIPSFYNSLMVVKMPNFEKN